MNEASTRERGGSDERADRDDHEKKKLHLTIFAPRATESKHFTWDPQTLVAVAAAEAATAFQYQAGTPTFVNKAGKALDRTQTLTAAGVQDHDTLELTDIGGGV